MAKKQPDFVFADGGQKGLTKTYFVSVDGASVGTVIHFWIKHLRMFGWEAIGHDGHRAVHTTMDKAAKALIWDGKGYPFPIMG